MNCPALAVDWPVVGDVLTAIGSLAAGGATIALAFFAYRGLSTWAHQVKGTRKIELIEEILTHVYEAEEIYKYMVHPFSTGSEHKKVERLENESDEDWNLRASYSVSQLRYNEHRETFVKLRTLAFRAKAVLGNEVWKALGDVIVLPRTYMNLAGTVYRAETEVSGIERQLRSGLTVHEARLERAHKNLAEAKEAYWGLTPDTQQEPKMAQLVSLLEAELAKHNVDGGTSPGKG